MYINDLIKWTQEADRKNRLDNVKPTKDDVINSAKLIVDVIDGKNPKLSDYNLKTYPFCVSFMQIITQWKKKNDIWDELSVNQLMTEFSKVHWKLGDEQLPMACIDFRDSLKKTLARVTNVHT